MNILILEDDSAFAGLLKLRLRDWKSEAVITVAATISAAKKLLENQPQDFFQLVLLDQHLPDGMGPELLSHPNLQYVPVLALSAEDQPELPVAAISAGAHHFLSKRELSSSLFPKLLDAVMAKSALERSLLKTRLEKEKLATVRRLVETLQHEVNNPLGAVIGASYLVKSSKNLSQDQQQAVALIEKSSTRIKQVMTALADAVTLEEVEKGGEKVFQVPGDPEWSDK